MPWWYPFGCIAFIVGGILIFLKPEWLWALTEQWKSYAADGPSDFYILNTKSAVCCLRYLGSSHWFFRFFLIDGSGFGQYRIILSADTASEVRQLLSQKRR